MKWTDDKIQELQNLYEKGHSAQEIADMFNVSLQSVKGAIFRNKNSVSRRRPKYTMWNEQTIATIERMLSSSMSLMEIANHLGVSYASLTSKMRRLNLRFTSNIEKFGYTPQTIVDMFNITNSQLRQLLNNKIIIAEIRGRNLIVPTQEIVRWLSSGYALLYRPYDLNSEWGPVWISAIEESLKTNVCIDEIAHTFEKTKMSISYYMKKKNFPPVVRYLNSYNICDRIQVNEWAKRNNMPLLPEKMSDKYFEMLSHPHSRMAYQEHLTNE